MLDLIDAYNDLRRFLAGKKTYIMATLLGLLGALKFAGYPVPNFIWPILGALGFDAVKAAWDKIPTNSGGE